ncbi:MAG: dihydrolipoamide acetyltransferase family protein [Nitrospiraceae bacterium]
MPKLTDTMEEGVVLKWKKQEGDLVGTGDVLAEIETDKAVMDLEAFASGTLKRVLVQEGTTVPAGALIAVISEPDEDITEALKDSIAPSQVGASSKAPAWQATETRPAGGAGRADQSSGTPSDSATVKASPRAKALAAERGIDLASVRGSGPDGRIVERDVMSMESMATAPTGGTTIPLTQMRKAIARTTAQSKAPVPHFYLTTEIAMDAVERVRAELKQSREGYPSITDMVVKAAALALVRHPEINVSFAGDALRRYSSIDIGIAVGLDDGLISPVIRDCGGKTLMEISTEARSLVERARNKRLQPQEYTGATFSVSNLGMFDVESFIAVLMPPQAAAIALGAVRDVPVVGAEGIQVGRRMKATLSCDHRALDGMQGARFLRELKRILEHPLEWVRTVESK